MPRTIASPTRKRLAAGRSSGKKRAATRLSTPGADIEGLLRTAVRHHEAGRLEEATRLYAAILERKPQHAPAWMLLGKAARESGSLEQAIGLMCQALSISPRQPEYYLELGGTLLDLKRFPEAVTALEEAVLLAPGSSRFRYSLGVALASIDRIDQAIAQYLAALDLAPRSPEIYIDLGVALIRKGDRKAAYASLRGALMLRPQSNDLLFQLGLSFGDLRSFDDAARCFRELIALEPTRSRAHEGLANVLNQSGRSQEALDVACAGLAIDPQSAPLHQEAGNAYVGLSDIESAIGSFRRAFSLIPHPNTACNLGFCLMEQGHVAEARAQFERALQLDPKHRAAYSNLIYFHAFAQILPPREQLRIARGWELAALTEAERAAARNREFPVIPLAGRKLRLGVLSAELGTHAVAEFLQPILESLNRERFHLTLYPTKIRTGARADHFRALADEYKPVAHLSDTEAAELIRSDGIDVLLETSGHTSDGRLGIIAHRSAPVQCTAIGFWASTGLSEMDWFLYDESAPPEFDTHFSERLCRLPRATGGCYYGNTQLPESAWTPSEDGTLWFGSFNRYSKIREDSIALWARVLRAIPQARLLLEDRSKYDGLVQVRILREFVRLGIFADRIQFAPVPPDWAAHMRNYDRLDVALDTIPFNSGTTAYDALWMGVPLVALQGDWSGGIMAATCVRTLGHPEWIASSPDEYVAIVSELAHNVDLRRELRRTQRTRMAASPLCNAPSMAADYENAFVHMYEEWAGRRKGMPIHDSVSRVLAISATHE